MNYSIYIHIPFCTHRCAYCDFNTYASHEAAIPAYVEALRREIELVGASERIPVHTVFFGGGTPSLLSPDQFQAILEAIRCSFDLAEEAEITTEANPGTVSPDGLVALRALGINRISFGAQSANGEELRMLERTHTFRDVMEAVSAARRAGFDNLNLDLIYGLPEQSVQTWQTTVRRVLDLHPEHLSAYALTLEHGTPFGRWSRRGLLPTPDPDAAAEMYEWASEAFERGGYGQYEISNWGMARGARDSAISRKHTPMGEERGKKQEGSGWVPNAEEWPEYACRHNLQYWRCRPYLGFGAGAHGYAEGYRYFNVLRIGTYIERLRKPGSVNREKGNGGTMFPLSPAAVNQHKQSAEDEMSEFTITGLRLTREGIAPEEYRERFGRELLDVYGKQIDELVKVGLLEWIGKESSERGEVREALRLTKRGRLLGNQVFMQFV